MPFTLVFIAEPPPALVAVGALFDVTMLLDILLSFNTAFVREDEVVVDRRAIARECAPPHTSAAIVRAHVCAVL